MQIISDDCINGFIEHQEKKTLFTLNGDANSGSSVWTLQRVISAISSIYARSKGQHALERPGYRDSWWHGLQWTTEHASCNLRDIQWQKGPCTPTIIGPVSLVRLQLFSAKCLLSSLLLNQTIRFHTRTQEVWSRTVHCNSCWLK